MCRYQQKMTLYRAYMVLLYTRFCFVGESGLISWKLDSQSHAKLRVLFWHRHKRGQQGQGLGHGTVAGRIRSHSYTSRVQGFLWWDSGRLSFTQKNMLRPSGGVHFCSKTPQNYRVGQLGIGKLGPKNLLTSWEWLAVFLGLTGVVFLMQWGQSLARAIEIGSSHVGFL